MENCLNGSYHQPDPLKHGWKLENGILGPIWYEGAALPSAEELSHMSLQSSTGNQESSSSGDLEEVHNEGTPFGLFDESDFESEDDEDYAPSSAPTTDDEDD